MSADREDRKPPESRTPYQPVAGGRSRPVVHGKFFRLPDNKFHVKGITYGPFAPNAEGEMFASREQTARDFVQISELGANVLRLYYVPPAWFLDLAGEHNLRLLVDIPWAKHLCFLDSATSQQQTRETVAAAVRSCRGHPAIFAYSVVNEISAEIVRWSGVDKVQQFIDELIDEARNIDSDCLYTFSSFPPTEFLHSENIDFVTFNVYLHQRLAFEDYLARLQTLADSKLLVLGEFGMDSIREGETHKCEFLSWQIEAAFKGGLAGTVVFSYTDDWFRGGLQIEDWGFGLTGRDRRPKESFKVVQQQYRVAPYFPLPEKKKVSVVVASYNGARTIRSCLESLRQLNYPDYEMIVVDDGSTDGTPDIVRSFPAVRHIRQENRGLSAARNAGIAAATGDIVAFTDDDCRADEDWLFYLVSDLVRSDFAAIGGHNFLPPDDSDVPAAVLASPGGPSHVMLTDREAEHIPGCNMAFYKWALDAIGGFDPIFTKAGDDVDVCWRLQHLGEKIGFSPSGFVWHYRRPTVRAYLKQQAGYGEAEALLTQKHPEYFNSFGQGIWRGRIYSAAHAGVIVRRNVIYHGPFGSGFFQQMYAASPALPLMLCTSLPFHAFVNVPLLLLSAYLPFVWPLAAASVCLSVGVCVLAAAQARLPRDKQRIWSRPLIATLFFLQPIVRGWHRFKWRLNLQSTKAIDLQSRSSDTPIFHYSTSDLAYWSRAGADRFHFLGHILSKFEHRGWSVNPDAGWTSYDAEIVATPWARLRLITVTEDLDQGRRNLRLRLAGAWSLPARLVFVAVCVLVLLMIALFARDLPWLWMYPVLLYWLHWFFQDEKLVALQSAGQLLDDVARDQALVKIE